MATILVIGETDADGQLTKLSTEVATLGRALAEASGSTARGIVAGSDDAATELARFLPAVTSQTGVPAGASATERAGTLAEAVTAADVALLPASPEGRDLAGVLSALTGRGVLGNATAARWDDGGPVTTHSVFGGKLITEAAFVDGRGIVTIRPNAVTGEPMAKPGTTTAEEGASPAASQVRRLGQEEASGAAAQIDDARIIVAGGRGVGGPDGFTLVQELADELGGAVGATRAAVDSGWIAYSQQIGQTGKIVKPALYLALGISGAIQHKVGMQTAETIIAVNRDTDAPIAEFADVFVAGDLFEVGRALLAELRSRSG